MNRYDNCVSTQNTSFRRRITPAFAPFLLAVFAVLAPAARAADSLTFFNNWFVTGDYAVAGVGLRGTGVNGVATNNIVMAGVPAGAEPIAAFLYWSTIEFVNAPGAANGTFRGYKIRGAVVGNPQNPGCYSSGGTTGTAGAVARTYRSDVLRYLSVNSLNIRQANGTHAVSLPDSGGNGNGTILYTNGASLVVIYRVVVPGVVPPNPAATPLRSIVIYNGAFTMDKSSAGFTQTVAGFYQAAGTGANNAKISHLVANGQAGFSSPLSVDGKPAGTNPFVGLAGGRWDNPTFNFALADDAASFPTQVTGGNNQTCLTFAAVVASTIVKDTDGDGLLDKWEDSGLHRNTQVSPATFGTCAQYPGEPCVNLPQMGANKGTKDIFIQIDWMHGNGDGTGGTDGHGAHNHIPKLAALDAVAKTFGPRGVNLHFDVGPNYQGNQLLCGNLPCSYIVPTTYAQGGSDLDESTLVCHDTATHPCGYHQPYPVLSFEFGFASIRDGNQRAGISAHFAQNRKDVFHYALFAHALAGPFDINGKPVDPVTGQPSSTPRSYSGIAQRPGGGFMVTLGLWRSDFAANDQVGSATVQAGTFMHELGHNLGLSHAGLVTQPNCMPNYQSVMNYLYQTRGLTDAGGIAHIDFSDGLLAGLSENSLSESASLGSLKYRLRYYGPFNSAIDPPAAAAQLTCDGKSTAGLPQMTRLENTFPAFVDWNHNLLPTAGILSQDLNFDGTPNQTFADQPDWTSLNLQQIGSGPHFGGLSVGAFATDGGTFATDAGAFATDAGALATDAGAFATDAGAFATDAGAFATDGGVFATDGGVFATDAGAFATDAGDLDFETVALSTIDPPPPPGSCPTCGLFATPKIDRTTLNWTAPETGKIVSYNIYRSDPAHPAATFLANVPGGFTTLTYDDVVNSSTTLYNVTYTYTVTSVVLINSQLNESLASTPASAVVKHLFISGLTIQRPYGDANPATLYDTDPAKLGLDPAAVPANVCTTTATSSSPLGVYPITCAGPAVVNTINGITYSNGTLTITPRPVGVAVTASGKTYDGTPAATLASCTLNGLAAADVGNVTCGGPATFASPNAGTWTVTATITLSGPGATNYAPSPTNPTTLATIAPKPVTPAVTAADKIFDGTAAATAACSLSGVIAADTGSVTCAPVGATFASIHGGTWTVTATGIALSGAKAGNYVLTSTTATTTATILPAPQSISFGPLADKLFGNPPFAVSATATSGLPVSFNVTTPGTWQCTVSVATVTLTGAGNCSITATQAGSSDYLAALPVAQAFHIAGFTVTGSMGVARSYHTATLLPNGKVLVAGGFDGSGAPLASSELYDPVAKTFSPVGSNLPNKAAGHTATLLTTGPDSGKVLIVGGGNSSSELYDPNSNSWSSAGGISGQRSFHTATVLPGGKILIAGGSDSNGKTTDTAIVYDPMTRSYTGTGNMFVSRDFHTAMLLTAGPNAGKVLIAGGRSSSGRSYTYPPGAELYDPATGVFTTAGNLVAARYAHTSIFLANGPNAGKILIAGGSAGSSALASAELYDPAAGVFAATGSMASTRQNFIAAVFGSVVVVAGGRDGSTRRAAAEAYGDTAFASAGNLLAARSGHTATQLLNGTLLVAGGEGASGVSLSSAELLQ